MPNDEPNINTDAADDFSALGFFNDAASGQEPNFFGNDNRAIGNDGDSPSPNADADFPQGEAGQQTQTGDTGAQGDANSGQQDQGSLDADGNPVPDKDRFEYWQSRADRIQNEYEKFKASVQSQSPILEYINSNPEIAQKVYGVVQESLNGNPGQSPTQGQSAQAGQLQKPQRPQKPQKPENYDPMDASTDTTSDSYKYRQQMEEYNDALADYNDQMVAYNENFQAQQQRQVQMNRQAQQQAREAYNEAVYRHNMNPNDAAKFVQWAQNPNYGMSDLIQLFKITNQRHTPGNQAAQNVNDRNQRLNAPIPPNVNGQTQTQGQQPYADMSEQKRDGALFTDALENSIMGQ